MKPSNTGTPSLITLGLLLLALFGAGISLWHLGGARTHGDRIRIHAEAASLARQLAAQAGIGTDHIEVYVATDNPVVRAFYKDGLLRSAREQLATLRRLGAIQPNESDRALYQALLESYRAYRPVHDAALAATAGDTATSPVFLSEDMSAHSRRYVDSAEALARHHGRMRNHLIAEARWADQLAYTGLVGSIVLSLGVGTWMLWHRRRRKRLASTYPAAPHDRQAGDGPREDNALFRAAATVEELAATIKQTEDALRKEPREQRREFFRVQVPIKNPATFTLTDSSLDIREAVFRVHDISAGGLRLVDADLLLGEATDQPCTGRLDMPGYPSVEVTLHILRVDQTLVTGTRYSQTIAGRYVDLSTNKQIPILQYIGELEREIMARRRIMD